MDNFYTRYRIEDRSYVAFIRREIHLKAVGAKFSEVDTGKIDIVVAELTSNLVKHAGSGELLYRISRDGDKLPVFEIICIDSAGGIDDVSRVMKDGVSSTRTLGQGLGAIGRLSTSFQIFSLPKWGTVLYANIGGATRSQHIKSGTDVDIKALCVPKPLEDVCGDGYRVKTTTSHVKILFGDGLGHGPSAKQAMDVAGDFFFGCHENNPVEILREMHEAVRKTRGLVAVVAVFSRQPAEWLICGIGNISARMYTGIEYKSYMSYNGTIGLNIPKSMNASQLTVERNQHLVLCSDGIQSRWDLVRYPSIFKFDSNILAGVLYKDFSRGNDDASTLIAKVV